MSCRVFMLSMDLIVLYSSGWRTLFARVGTSADDVFSYLLLQQPPITRFCRSVLLDCLNYPKSNHWSSQSIIRIEPHKCHLHGHREWQQFSEWRASTHYGLGEPQNATNFIHSIRDTDIQTSIRIIKWIIITIKNENVILRNAIQLQ